MSSAVSVRRLDILGAMDDQLVWIAALDCAGLMTRHRIWPIGNNVWRFAFYLEIVKLIGHQCLKCVLDRVDPNEPL